MVAIMPGQGERFAGKEVNRHIRTTTLNMGTMRGRSNEIFEMLSKITDRHLLCARIKMEA